jgi:formylglycine-generating enzyme required for sulfatase activity
LEKQISGLAKRHGDKLKNQSRQLTSLANQQSKDKEKWEADSSKLKVDLEKQISGLAKRHGDKLESQSRQLTSLTSQQSKDKEKLEADSSKLKVDLENLPQQLEANSSQITAITILELLKQHYDKQKGKSPQLTNSDNNKKVFCDKLKDGSCGPKMVRIPAGKFKMGNIENDDEQPVINRFAMGRYEVTFDEYDTFAKATGRKKPDDEDWGRGNRPVINVSWDDAVAYTKWLSRQTGKKYRLPYEAEWEYASRAGTNTKYWWGNEIGKNNANCNGCGSRWDNKQQTASVGSFNANPFGLYDTIGNVCEWVADSWHGNDGSVWEGIKLRVLRGDSWASSHGKTRTVYRFYMWNASRDYDTGFRVARDVDTE